jgi:hypothetical protein
LFDLSLVLDRRLPLFDPTYASGVGRRSQPDRHADRTSKEWVRSKKMAHLCGFSVLQADWSL